MMNLVLTWEADDQASLLGSVSRIFWGEKGLAWELNF